MAERTGVSRPTPCMIEHLEPRQMMAAQLTVQNLDIIPGFERMIFNRIRNPNITIPNYVKDRGTLRLTNSGDQTLRINDYKITGPFKILGMPPSSIPAGKSVSVTVEFTATAPPAFTYNQTNGNTSRQTLAGAHIGSLVFKTNDPGNATYTEGLAGWFQTDSEKDQEPNLQTFVNLISDFKTNISDTRTVLLPEGSTPVYYGEEVASGYWQAADPSRSISVRHISAFHTQGEDVRFQWFLKSNPSPTILFRTDGAAGQAFLPYLLGKKGTAATGSFSPGNSVFGIRIDNEYSVASMNTSQTGGGHHIRFYPARDHFGNTIGNSYLVAMDYAIAGSQNFDFQDNIYLVTNLKPAGN